MTRAIQDLKAGVVGTGFIGVVHVEALRRLGVEVLGVVGSTPERAAAKAIAPVYPSYEAMLEDGRVDVVHLTTPNHLHYPQVKQALAAGKHVVCEKPLAMSSEQSGELVELAERSGLVHCTNFNIRFYPQCHEARARIAAGQVGEVWNVHGSYLQDWLLLPTDWNWRLEPDQGGELRAVGDIGSHWLDLAQFFSGRKVVSLLADLQTTIPIRQRPTGPVETFAQAEDVEREPAEMRTEDLAHILLQLEGGARGSVVVSQVSAGRRNAVSLEVDGASGSIAWGSERNEELWLGHRGRPNELLWRDQSLMEGPVRGSVPAGHHEGFQDTFKELYRAVYRAVAAGEPGEDYPTFRDGHWENVLGDAVARSNAERAWVEVSE
jgi:predicted dehydrogenase